MRTLTKNAPVEITASRAQVGQVIVAAHETDDGKIQHTWAIDAIDSTPNGPRFHVSSPRSGKHAHTVLFGADGSVKVTGAVSGTVGRAPKPNVVKVDAVASTTPADVKPPARTPRKRSTTTLEALTAVVAACPPAAPAPTSGASAHASASNAPTFADKLAAKLADRLGAKLDALVSSALDAALDAAIDRVLA